MSACHPPTPRTPLATEPNTPYCPINAVDPEGLRQYIVRSNGQVDFFGDDIEAFIRAVKNAEPGAIDKIVFGGHGGTTGVFDYYFEHVKRGEIAPGLQYVPGMDKKLFFRDKTGKKLIDAETLFRGKRIRSFEFRTCDGAGTLESPDHDNLASRLATVLPGSIVEASRGPYDGPSSGPSDLQTGRIKHATRYYFDTTLHVGNFDR